MSIKRRKIAASVVLAADKIAGILAHHEPEWQSSVLADLTARWLAGCHPELREQVFKMHNELVLELTAVNEFLKFGVDRHPGWKDLEPQSAAPHSSAPPDE